MKPFNWHNPYPSVRIPLFARNIVSTSHPLAAQVGVRMLYEGGSAVDAAIAAAAVITLVEPVSCGLGSDAFAIVWADGQSHGLNASGYAPGGWDLDYFAGKYGCDAQGYPLAPKRGVDSVTIPGVVAGWAALHEKFGKLPFEQLMRPAVEVAERGYAVAPIVAHKWAAAVPELKDQPGFAQAFMPNGRAPHVGERFALPGAAKALRLIGQSQGRAMYDGELASRTVQYLREHGGVHTLDDFAQYQPQWVKPLVKDYQSYTLHELPPNGQGIAALMALGILKHFDLCAYSVDSVMSQHLQIEAMKLAFADLYRFVSDPATMTVSTEELLDDHYLASRARLIDPNKATDFGPGVPDAGGTIYLSAADESGMMVSFIQSNYMGFGSGVVVPDLGISLQNRGAGFSMNPASPNVVAGRKRPFHTIIPGFLSQGAKPVMSFGVMGGDMQPQGHLQTLVRMLDYDQQPQAACCAPRWKVNRDFTLDVESTMDASLVGGLTALGHRLKSIDDPYMDFGSGQFIWRLSENLEDGYVAASDSRRDGQAVGF
jgi:gamma-glutamyltranspeptidase / glutathione hydrolase